MRTVIVLGATSMLGHEIERQLRGRDIVVIRAGRALDSDIVVDLGTQAPVQFLKPCSKASVLIHCASAFGGDDSEGLKTNLSVNVAGCSQVLEIAQRASVQKIVYAGSVSSDESLESGYMGTYGFSKAEAERILSWGAGRCGSHFCSLRLPQLWDTNGDCCAHQPWFGRIVAYAARGLTLKMPATNGTRNFMHVSDAAQLLIRAAELGVQGIHAVSHPVDIDFLEIAKHAYRVFDNGGAVVIDPTKESFRKVNFPRADRVFSMLGYYPKISLEEGLFLIRDAGTAFRFGPVDVQ